MSTLSLGTSSWNFGDWKGTFYPEKLPTKHQLSFYASHFNTVEVNTSFYALPAPATLINWTETVPPGFRFSLKMPRAITHEKRLRECEAETRAYLDAVRSLGSMAAPSLLQLPPTLTRQNSGRVLASYLDWLAENVGPVRVAVEVRSPDLMTAAFAEFLAARNMALVLVDRSGSEDMFDAWLQLVDAGKTPEFAFIRWIGDADNGPQNYKTISQPRDNALALWGERIATLMQYDLAIYGYMHNPYEGHSPESIRRLTEQLAAQNVEQPEWPPEGWVPPHNRDASSGQLSLFD